MCDLETRGDRAPGTLRLISHHLCPYVQRAVIVAAEKGVRIERRYIDLAAKPDWFLNLSPTGKVPVLQVGDTALFESAAICEYLDETTPGALLPTDHLERARSRAWIEFASGVLSDIAGLYSAADADAFALKRAALAQRFIRLDDAIAGPWFGGEEFGLVDAAFGPVFRYLDSFETLAGIHLAANLERLSIWRAALAGRPSIRDAVSADYAERLTTFLRARGSHLSRLIEGRERSPA